MNSIHHQLDQGADSAVSFHIWHGIVFSCFSVAAATATATATATAASFNGLLNYFIGSNRKFQIHDFLFNSE